MCLRRTLCFIAHLKSNERFHSFIWFLDHGLLCTLRPSHPFFFLSQVQVQRGDSHTREIHQLLEPKKQMALAMLEREREREGESDSQSIAYCCFLFPPRFYVYCSQEQVATTLYLKCAAVHACECSSEDERAREKKRLNHRAQRTHNKKKYFYLKLRRKQAKERSERERERNICLTLVSCVTCVSSRNSLFVGKKRKLNITSLLL